MTKVEQFHFQRRMFALPYNIIKLAPKGDLRSHAEWLWDELHFDRSCLRGFIDPTGLYFYRTKDCKALKGDWERVKCAIIILIVSGQLDIDPLLPVYSGMIPGKHGERWEPRHKLGVIRSLIPMVELL